MPRVFKQFAVAVLAAAALSAALSGCSGSKANGAGGKDVAATVNGKNITLSEVDRVISQQTGGQQSKMMPLELATVRLQALAGLVEQEILFQRADKEKLLPSDDEVTHAREVIAVLARAEQEAGAGAVELGGQMLDEAMRAAALRTLARAGRLA